VRNAAGWHVNVRSVRVLEKSGLGFEKMIEYRSVQVAQYATNRGTSGFQPDSGADLGLEFN
jgi:hypothetical protein